MCSPSKSLLSQIISFDIKLRILSPTSLLISYVCFHRSTAVSPLPLGPLSGFRPQGLSRYRVSLLGVPNQGVKCLPFWYFLCYSIGVWSWPSFLFPLLGCRFLMQCFPANLGIVTLLTRIYASYIPLRTGFIHHPNDLLLQIAARRCLNSLAKQLGEHCELLHTCLLKGSIPTWVIIILNSAYGACLTRLLFIAQRPPQKTAQSTSFQLGIPRRFTLQSHFI